MKDYSLHGYLQRRSTEELEHILDFCLREYNYVNYEHVILETLRVLEERYVPDCTSEDFLKMRERLLQYKPKGDPDSQEQPCC